MSEAFLGLDLGTGSVRGLLVAEDGRVLSSRESPHHTLFPRPLWAEQDPREWADGLRQVLRAVAEDARQQGVRLAALGLTGQMHGAVVLDREDQPIRPAIIWMDQRCEAEAREMDAYLSAHGLRGVTANPALPNFTAPKLAWLFRHEPEHARRVAHLLLPKDFLRLVLTGEHATDVSDASGSLMLDVPHRTWGREVREWVGLPEEALPRLYESGEVTGVLRPELAQEVGLPPGLPVVAGAGDQLAGALGAGASDGKALMLSLGTSGVLLGALSWPGVPKQGSLHAMCAALPGRWVWMGVTQAAGGSLKWLRDRLFPGHEYPALDAEAAAVPPGSEGLVFLPYLMGERSPHLDPAARGAFVGLTASHGRGHVVRAVLEGVAYSLRQVADLLQAEGLPPAAVHATGGGARSPLWRAILAATLEQPVRRVVSPEGPAYGAAILAAQAVGHRESVAWPRAEEDPPPPADWVDTYRRHLSTYAALYPALKPTFAALQ